MMNKQSMGKRFGAVALAAVLGVSPLAGAVVPAFADDASQIGITKTTNQTYAAHQVFAAQSDTDGKLSVVTWGSGVNGDALLKALKADATLGNDFKDCTTAAEVAAVMTKENGYTSDLGEANSQNVKTKKFADIVAANLQGDGTALTASGDKMVADVDPGYYLIQTTGGISNGVDDDGQGKWSETKTRFMLQVSNSKITIDPKSDKVESDKDITDADDEDREDADDRSIGDIINYDIKGTLPGNFADYKMFWFTFDDTLSAGLTLLPDEGITVSLYKKNGSKVRDLASTEYSIVTKDPQKLVVSVPKIVGMEGAEAGGQIIVSYKAKLNENAVIGGEGNPNTFKIKYNSDPNWDNGGKPDTPPSNPPEEETPEDKNVIFTYELDASKVDSKDHSKKLKDAEFKLQNAEGKYAVIEGGKIVSWSSEDGTTLTSDDNGNFSVKGLDAGTYTLVETKAPEGYVLPQKNTFQFTITAEVDGDELAENGDTKRLESLKIGEEKGDVAKGSVSYLVENSSETELPHTGGMGTVIFTVVGAAMMGGAVAISVKRRNQE